MLRIKSVFSLWKIYSHVIYTSFDHIASIACFRKLVFWSFRSISCFSVEFNIIFSFSISLLVVFYSSSCLFFTRLLACFLLTFLHVLWSRRDLLLFEFFVVLTLLMSIEFDQRTEISWNHVHDQRIRKCSRHRWRRFDEMMRKLNAAKIEVSHEWMLHCESSAIYLSINHR